MLVDKRREVLRLYREILRTTRQFKWPNEQGEQWSLVLQKNARMEIEQNRNETDGETISKRIIFGWDCLAQVQEKMVQKQQDLEAQAAGKAPDETK